MPEYKVKVKRLSWGFHDIFVAAGSPEEAEVRAVDMAGDYLLHESSADYEAEHVEEVED